MKDCVASCLTIAFSLRSKDLEEEVVDRESLKKQSGSILDKATKKTKKRRSKKSG